MDQFLVLIQSSASSIHGLAERQGLRVLGSVGSERPSYLVASWGDLPGDSVLESLRSDPDVERVERVNEVRLPDLERRSDSYDYSTSIRAWLSSTVGRSLIANRAFAAYYGAPVWGSYLVQPSVRITQAPTAHWIATGRDVTVAIIDTGIANHPALGGNLVPGYDFVRNRAWTAEQGLDDPDAGPAGLQQGTTVVINVAAVQPLTGNSGSGFEQSNLTAPDVREYASLGHGTMVAGVVHLIAPQARIMPLRVFGPDGRTDTAKIIRAIYFAVDNGARVINMSFATSVLSEELMRAVNYATRQGVICVASAGNHGRATMIYPASLANVVGVAATDDRDARSAFSNFGPDVAAVAAPGEGIVTTYPDGRYAVGWGTSFSAAFVSAGAALLLDISSTLEPFEIANTLARAADRLIDDPGHGRVNLWVASVTVAWGGY